MNRPQTGPYILRGSPKRLAPQDDGLREAEFLWMLDHVSITVSDIAAAERFYDAMMKALGVVKVAETIGSAMASGRGRPIRIASISPFEKVKNPKTRSAAIGASRRDGRPRSMRSGTPALPLAAPTTAHRACAIITRPIMRPSCATPTAIASRRCAITRCEYSAACRLYFPSGARRGSRIATCVPFPGSLLRRRRPPRRSVTTL
jgi:hypothetical protein